MEGVGVTLRTVGQMGVTGRLDQVKGEEGAEVDLLLTQRIVEKVVDGENELRAGDGAPVSKQVEDVQTHFVTAANSHDLEDLDMYHHLAGVVTWAAWGAWGAWGGV